MGSKRFKKYPCQSLSSKPSLARRIAGCSISSRGNRPRRLCTCRKPFKLPGTATEPSPILKSWSEPGKWMVTGKKWGSSTVFSRPLPGVSVKKSNRISSPCLVRASKKPPPPRLVRVCSATAPAKPAPTAASKALPPFCKISTAAPLTRGCPVATIALLNFFIARIWDEVL